MSTIGKLYALVGADITEYARKMDAVAMKAKTVGKAFSLYLTAPIVALGAISVKMAADFEQSLVNAASVAGATGEEFEAMEKAARDMGQQTAFSAKEAADGLYYMASAGWEAQQMVVALQPTLELAGATQSDLAFTTETVIGTLNMFELAASEAGRVTNTFAAAIGGSQATLERLGTSMSYVGPVANGMNMSLEDTTAALMGLYDKGVDASMAGTGLRMMLSKLLDPTKKVHENLKALNLTIDDVDPNTKSWREIIKALEDAGVGAENAGYAFKIFGARAGNAVLNLVKTGVEGFDDLRGSLDNATARQEMYERQMDTFAGQWKILTSALSEVAIQIGKILIPAIRSLIEDHIMPAVQWFIKLDDGMKKTIITVAGLAAAIGPLAMAVSKLVSVLGGAPAILAALTSPVGLVVTGLGLLAVAAYKAYNAIKDLTRSTDDWRKIAKKADEEAGRIVGFETFMTKAKQAGFDMESLAQAMVKNKNDINKTMEQLVDGQIRGAEDLRVLYSIMVKDREKQLKEEADIAAKHRRLQELDAQALKDKELGYNLLMQVESGYIESQDDMRAILGDINTLLTESNDLRGHMRAKLQAAADELERMLELQGAEVTLVETQIEATKSLAVQVNAWKYEVIDLETVLENTQDTLKEFTETAVGAARDMAGVYKQAVGEMDEDTERTFGDEGTSTKTLTGFAKAWEDYTDGLRTAWAQAFSDMIQMPSWMRDHIAPIFQTIYDQFADMVGQMISKWLTGFIQKFVSSTKDAATTVVGSVKDVASSAANLAKGFSPGGMIATAVGTAVGSFLGNILSGGGAGKRDTQLIKDNTWETAQHAKNIVGNADAIKWATWNNEGRLQSIMETGWSMWETFKTVPEFLDYMLNSLVKAHQPLRSVAKSMNELVRIFENIKKFQHGGFVEQPQLAIVGEVPEYIIPASQMGGGAGGMGASYNINMHFSGMDGEDVYRVMSTKGLEALITMIQNNEGGLTREIKENSEKY